MFTEGPHVLVRCQHRTVQKDEKHYMMETLCPLGVIRGNRKRLEKEIE